MSKIVLKDNHKRKQKNSLLQSSHLANNDFHLCFDKQIQNKILSKCYYKKIYIEILVEIAFEF